MRRGQSYRNNLTRMDARYYNDRSVNRDCQFKAMLQRPFSQPWLTYQSDVTTTVQSIVSKQCYNAPSVNRGLGTKTMLQCPFSQPYLSYQTDITTPAQLTVTFVSKRCYNTRSINRDGCIKAMLQHPFSQPWRSHQSDWWLLVAGGCDVAGCC